MWPFRRKRRQTREAVPDLSAADLRQRLDPGDALILDVRQPAAFAEYPGAIPGSLRLPPTEIPDRYPELPADRLILVYCTQAYQATSARVASYLRNREFPDVRLLRGGYPAWLAAGFPVEDARDERRLVGGHRAGHDPERSRRRG